MAFFATNLLPPVAFTAPTPLGLRALTSKESNVASELMSTTPRPTGERTVNAFTSTVDL